MNKKRLLAVLIATIMSASVAGGIFSGCRSMSNNIGVDNTKSQLYISNHDGGYGSTWLDRTIARFTEKYAEVSFEEGKQGVQIWVDKNKTLGTSLVGTIAGSSSEIFFCESGYYYSFVNNDLILDITDIVTETKHEYQGIVNYNEESIESKLSQEQRTYYGVQESDGETHYYALPHYQSFRNIVYNIDLFEERGFYFASDGTEKDAANYTVVNGTKVYEFVGRDQSKRKSAGPDGNYGTFDDGLPATYEQFFALCERLYSSNVIPVSWTGRYQEYFTDFMTAIYADFEGAEQIKLNYTLDGMATSLVDIDENGDVTPLPDEQIDNTKGYLLAKQEGRYRTLQFAEQLINNSDKYIYPQSWSGNQTHMNAQTDFIRSYYDPSMQPIAMLFEGIYWENEAENTFPTLSQYGVNSRMDVNYGVMPIPKYSDGQIGHERTLFEYLNAVAFINANIDESKIELAKCFLQFCYTDEELVDFTITSGCPKAVDYELGDKIDELSTYGQSVWYIKENSTIVYPCSTNSLYKSYPSTFLAENFWMIGGASPIIPSRYIEGGVSALTYINQIRANNTQEIWNAKYDL